MITTSKVITQLKISLANVCNGISSIMGITPLPKVIQGYSSGIEPNVTYISIDILSDEIIGGVDHSTFISFVDGKSVIRLTEQHETKVQLTFVGDGSGDIAYDFSNSITGNHIVTELFQKNSLSPIKRSQLRSNYQKRDTTYIESYNFDVLIGYSATINQETDYVKLVTIVEKIKN